MDFSWVPPMLTGALIGVLGTFCAVAAWACVKVDAYDEAEYGGSEEEDEE